MYSLFLSKRILKRSASNVLKRNSDNFLSKTKIYNKTELFIPEATIAVLMILHQRVFVSLCSNNTEIWQVFMYLLHFPVTILQKSTVDKWWLCHKLYPFRHIICFYFSWKNKMKQIIFYLLVVSFQIILHYWARSLWQVTGNIASGVKNTIFCQGRYPF